MEARVRQVRVLIYEGPADWVRRTVSSEGRYVYGRRVLSKDAEGRESMVISEYLAPADSTMIALIDIDGTIADLSHRLHYIQSDPKDWDKFFDEMVYDSRIPGMDTIIYAISREYTIVYLTGRPDSHRLQTIKWLQDNSFPFGEVIMRKAGDHRPDTIVKRELFEKEVLSQMGVPKLVIEDRKQMVDMWRSMGLLCFQCKDGDY